MIAHIIDVIITNFIILLTKEAFSVHRNDLLEKLSRYKQKLISLNSNNTLDTKSEITDVETIINFIKKYPDCFDREQSYGHITGSAWLLNTTQEKALLMHHRKLKLWLQPGGHADGDSDILHVAIKEAQEESGIAEVEAIDTEIFDVDIHHVDHGCSHGLHYHFDIRFLLKAKYTDKFVANHESLGLKWNTLDELNQQPDLNSSVKRLAKKWEYIIN